MPLEIDSATDDLSNDLGKLITDAGQEDASGARRMLNTMFANRNWPGIARMLKTDEAEARRLGDVLFGKYGTPEQEKAPAAMKDAVIEAPPICDTCNRYTEPFHGSSVCNCYGVQTYALSNYPGECRLVKAHPANIEQDGIESQYYQRKDIDPLLKELRAVKDEHVQALASSSVGQAERMERFLHDPAYPDPTPEDLASPLFEAVWQAIKGWDLSRYGSGGPGRTLYEGATGNEVMHILRAIEKCPR